MSLNYYFITSGGANIEEETALQDAIDLAALTIYKTTNGFSWSCPNSVYLRTIGYSWNPSILAIDNTDDTLLNQTNDPDTLADFITASQALYDAKHPT